MSKSLAKVLVELLVSHRALSKVIGSGKYSGSELAAKTRIEDRIGKLVKKYLPVGTSLDMNRSDSSDYTYPGRLSFNTPGCGSIWDVDCTPGWDGFNVVVSGGGSYDAPASYIDALADVFGVALRAPVDAQPQYIVGWCVDAEAMDAHSAASEVADLYFQERIADGEPGSACVFTVTNTLTGEVTEVDLSVPAPR